MLPGFKVNSTSAFTKGITAPVTCILNGNSFLNIQASELGAFSSSLQFILRHSNFRIIILITLTSFSLAYGVMQQTTEPAKSIEIEVHCLGPWGLTGNQRMMPQDSNGNRSIINLRTRSAWWFNQRNRTRAWSGLISQGDWTREKRDDFLGAKQN